MFERNISTTTHGRYLVEPATVPGAPVLAGFHGYAEQAEHELQRLNSIPGAEHWLRVAVQALHRFYRGRSTDVVASWMTKQDRTLAIADNCAYVSQVLKSVADEWQSTRTLVCNGFSQGVAMAFRAAANSPLGVRGVLACGGDIPPELDRSALSKIPAVLLGRGIRDEWYTDQKLEADERRLQDAGVAVEIVRFDGGHEWPPEFARAAGEFLSGLRR